MGIFDFKQRKAEREENAAFNTAVGEFTAQALMQQMQKAGDDVYVSGSASKNNIVIRCAESVPKESKEQIWKALQETAGENKVKMIEKKGEDTSFLLPITPEILGQIERYMQNARYHDASNAAPIDLPDDGMFLSTDTLVILMQGFIKRNPSAFHEPPPANAHNATRLESKPLGIPEKITPPHSPSNQKAKTGELPPM